MRGRVILIVAMLAVLILAFHSVAVISAKDKTCVVSGYFGLESVEFKIPKDGFEMGPEYKSKMHKQPGLEGHWYMSYYPDSQNNWGMGNYDDKASAVLSTTCDLPGFGPD